MGVGLMTYLSTLGQTNLVQTQAALTAPPTWNYGFIYNATQDLYRLTNSDGSNYGWPGFVKTTASSFNSYSWNSATGYFDDGDNSTPDTLPQQILPNGLNVVMTFNRSNTTWFDLDGYSYADDTKIGSNSSVGTIADKYSIHFKNYTNKHYRVYADLSSTGNGFGIVNTWWYNNILYGTSSNFTSASFFIPIAIIPPFTEYRFAAAGTGSANYFDAWYLQDLGIAQSWQDGYDEGQEDGFQDGLTNNPNLLINGFEAMVGILINMVFMVLNLSVFDVSLLNIFGIIVLFVGIIWILRLIRG
jgi:hypothetical protein